MRTVAIIQARMGSTRLPGKVLADIAGRPMLAHVVSRCRAAASVEEVMVATTERPADDPLVELCGQMQVGTFRGAEEDVLQRYAGAAAAAAADVVVRITSDCPLLDPAVLDEVVATFRQRHPDYASNCIERTFPRGLDVEVMSAAALQRADREAREPHEREHVTPYIYLHPELFTLVSVHSGRPLGELRWTVDTPADLRFVREVMVRAGASTSWLDVLALVEAEPGLAAINRDVRQKRLEER